ncbi:uncharacterized protein [Phaseolus vulgaris]|uniref:uncharacterized protein n=1 Tax=Phaseolus vulgaris TaxID=3885 RepID=UPI0035CB2F62
MVVQEGEAESSKGRNLWDPSLDAPKERLVAHDKNHLVHEGIRQFGQALARSCLVVAKMKEWKAEEDLKAQEIFELRKEIELMQSQLQHTKDSQQEVEGHLTEKTKEAANQAQEAAVERGRLLAEVDKLKGKQV